MVSVLWIKGHEFCSTNWEVDRRRRGVTGNVGVGCRQMEPESSGHHDTSGQDRNRHRGLERSVLLFNLNRFVPIIGAMTKQDCVFWVFFLRFPAKKLVRHPKESTNQTRKAMCYFQFLCPLVGEGFIYKYTYIIIYKYISIYTDKGVRLYTHIYNLYLPEFLTNS